MAMEDSISSFEKITGYHYFLFFILTVSTVFCGCQMGAMIFIGMTSPFHCSVNTTCGNISDENLWRLVSPVDNMSGEIDGCSRYELPSNEAEFCDVLLNTSSTASLNLRTVPCDSWSFEPTYMKSSIVSEFEMICGGEWKPYFSQSIFMLGVLLNGVVFGAMSDKFGRKKTYLATTSLCLLSGVLVAFSQSFTMFTLLRGVVGLAFVFPNQLVYVIELVETKNRAMAAQLLECAFSLGFAILGPIAHFTKYWRDFELAISIPIVTVLVASWFMYESPRWLMSRMRFAEAEENAKKIISFGKSPSSDDIHHNEMKEETSKFIEDSVNVKAKPKLRDLFRNKEIRNMTFILYALFFCICCTYYGLTLNAAVLGSDPYISLMLGSLVEIIAAILSVFAVDKWGRWPVISSSFFLAGICCTVIGFIPKESLSWLVLIVFLLGKVGSFLAFCLLFVVVPELYPSAIRTIGTGSCSGVSRIGGIVSPLVAMLGIIYYPMPYVIFGFLSLVSGFLALLLPETLNSELTDTVEEGAKFIRNNPGMLVVFYRKKFQRRSVDIE